MDVETVRRSIEFILAPVVMLTACSVFVSGLLAHFGAHSDRLRAMARERLELLRLLRRDPEDWITAERLLEIDAQLPGMLRRHRQIRDAMLATYLALALYVVSMFAIAGSSLASNTALAITALGVFLVATAVLLSGVVVVTLEVNTSHLAIQYEVRRAAGLSTEAAERVEASGLGAT